MSTYIPSFFHSLKWWCGLVFEAPGSGSLTLLTLYWITSFCNIIVASVNLQSFPKLLSHLYWAESSKLDFGRFFKILIGSVPLAPKKENNLRTQCGAYRNVKFSMGHPIFDILITMAEPCASSSVGFPFNHSLKWRSWPPEITEEKHFLWSLFKIITTYHDHESAERWQETITD